MISELKIIQCCSTGLNVQKSRVFVLATFLDPRYKTRFLQDVSTARGWIVSELVAASTKDLQKTPNTREKSSAPSSTSEDQADVNADAHEDIWKCFDEIAHVSKSDEDSSLDETNAGRNESEVLELQRQPSDRSKKKIAAYNAELDKYLAQPLLSREENPLLWWRLHTKEYPKLTPLVLKYLSAPPSSVNSERLFSAAGRIYTENRNRLLPQNAEMLLFIMKNIKIVDFKY